MDNHQRDERGNSDIEIQKLYFPEGEEILL
jgi:hypothetical protein